MNLMVIIHEADLKLKLTHENWLILTVTIISLYES